jgi:hypothetical protein
MVEGRARGVDLFIGRYVGEKVWLAFLRLIDQFIGVTLFNEGRGRYGGRESVSAPMLGSRHGNQI